MTHDTRRLCRGIWVIVCICSTFPLARAQSFTLAPVYDNVATQGAHTLLKAPPGVQLQAANDGIHGTARVTVAGRQVVMPAIYRLAANAPTYAVGAIRQMHPALLGASLLAYLMLENIMAEGDQYVKPGYSTTPIKNGWYLEYSHQWPCYSGPTYRSDIPSKPHGCSSPLWDTYETSGYALHGYYQSTQVSCGWYSTWRRCTAPAAQPVTEEDWQRLQQHPLPIPAAIELATTPHGVPVHPQLDSQPSDYPLAQPYSHPDGTWRQPMVRLTPMPDGTVQAVPWERIVTGPEVGPDGLAEPVPGEQPIMRPDISDQETRRQQDEQDRPDYDTPTEPIPTGSHTVSIAPVPLGMPSGCPSPRVVATPWGTISLSYDYACQAADYIRPVLLALAGLTAVMVFVGGLKDD